MIFKAAVDDLRELLWKKVFCGIYDISWLEYRKSKNRNDFVNIMYYLIINRNYKQNINFSQNGGVPKKIFDFLIKF